MTIANPAAAVDFVDALRPLGRATLREEAERILRAEIVVGALAPGTLYPIARIAEQLEVSVTPVRDAVLSLERDGLLQVVRNRGFRVVELSDKDLDDLVDLRTMLEVPAMRRLASGGAPPDLDRLRTLGADIERAARDGDLVTFVRLDRELHLQLLARVGNPRLTQVVSTLRDQTRLSGLGGIAGSDVLLGTTREHDRLLDAIEAGDPDMAGQVMSDHLAHARGVWAGRDESATSAATRTDPAPRHRSRHSETPRDS